MRVTNGMMQRAALYQVQSSLQRVSEAQEKVSTGLRIRKASDDPSAASSSMRARGTLRALEQYKRGIEVANSRSTTEESILSQLSDVLTRAKVLAIGQAGDTADATTRAVVKAEIDQLFEHAVQLANSRLGEEFVFGGAKATVQPFTLVTTGTSVDYTSTSPTGEHRVQIAEGRHLVTSHNGVEVFEDTGALAALRELSESLGSNDQEGITSVLYDLDTAMDGVETLIGDVGARVNHLRITQTHLEDMELNLLGYKSELEEVHIEEAMTELVARQTTYQAAMLATSRVMGLSLADYLR